MSSNESIHDEMEDSIEMIQDNEGTNEEVMETVTRDDVPEDPNNQENAENKTVVKPKRVIRNPKPKLNALTLMGPKGLTALEGYFDRVKFKGKGYEEHDLNVLMKTYEYWCHRLFPKYPMDACIERLETLGIKRATITQIKKIRMGITHENEDKLLDTDEELPQDPMAKDGFVNEINDQFDQLLPVTFQAENTAITKLTEEQLAHIHLNRKRAEKIRREKLDEIKKKSSSLSPSNTQQSDNMFSCSYKNTETLSENDVEMRVNEITDINHDVTENFTDNNDQGINTEMESVHNESQVVNLTKIQMERLRQNKERAIKIRHEKMGRNKINTVQDHNNDSFNDFSVKETEKSYEQLNLDRDSIMKNTICGDKINTFDETKIIDDANDEVDLDHILDIININEHDENGC